tara:strand:+ start:5124 stop:6374 length:1251 start_codon:yes stop_codon:yes gene_type:complete
MKKKNKLILVESEMLGPKGHFLDNLIETTNTFRKQNTICWILNKNFDHRDTYLPDNIRIFKSIFSNNFKRKKNKIFYILEEFIFFLINLGNNFYYLVYFTLENKTLKYLKALKSNYFLIPRYFPSFYTVYKKLRPSKNDHIFFQTARRKDIALTNFLIKIDENHPKFHIRVMLPPKKRFKGFFYYLKQINRQMINGKVFLYVWSNFNFKYFLKNSVNKYGIFKSNIPSSFYNRKIKNKDFVVGFMGDARRARGFQHLPEIIKKLHNKNKTFKYIIQFSSISEDLLDTKEKLYKLSKKNKNIKLIEKYCDYKEFRNILKKIDIMPIIHKSGEINKITSGTMYSCVSNQIPIVIPKGVNFMNEILKYKSYETSNNIDDISVKIIKISKNYNYYLKNVKLNSDLLKSSLRNDPLRKNIN